MFTSLCCCSWLSPAAHRSHFELVSSSSLPCPDPGRRVLILEYASAVFPINTAATCGNWTRSSHPKYIKNNGTKNKELHLLFLNWAVLVVIPASGSYSLPPWLWGPSPSALLPRRLCLWLNSVCHTRSAVPAFAPEELRQNKDRCSFQNEVNNLVVKMSFCH